VTIRTVDGSLPIAIVSAGEARGEIGFSPCPGTTHTVETSIRCSLAADLDSISAWGAVAVVTLVTEQELQGLGVATLGSDAARRGLAWFHLPIDDFSTPDAAFEQRWPEVSSALHGHLRQRHRVLLHCRGGLGRSGMIAARLLVECGLSPTTAIEAVRAARPGAIETEAQEHAVLALAAASR
jgi:ADP-ribosyl-[dinitrogen reductase] hydrolase